MDQVYFPDAELPLETVQEGGVWRKLRARGGGLMAVEVVFRQGAAGAAHRHRHEQLSCILEGRFRFTVEGASRDLGPGDSLYVPPSALHGVVCLAAGRILDVFTPQREDFLAH
jgi:quercetin dioxygenase-like cupin family protein